MEAVLGEKNTYLGIGMALTMLPLSLFGFLLFVFVSSNAIYLILGPALGLPIGLTIGLTMWKKRCAHCEGPSRNFDKHFLFNFALGTASFLITCIILLIVFI